MVLRGESENLVQLGAHMAGLVREADTTAWDVMRKSFRPNLDEIQIRLAFLETLSHLEHLKETGRIRDDDREGVTFYRA